MATSTSIVLRPEDVGVMNFGKQSKEAAEKTSELLEKNHYAYHTFFNTSGFHNHIVHHLLSLYAAGAPASMIQKQYDHNASYQRPQRQIDLRVVEDMNDPEKFKKFLGNEKYYRDFLVFFQKQIAENDEGWQGVLKEVLWSGDERGEDLLVRMFAGLMHPIIHLGFGIEFHQPAIIAEALAQAAIHDNWIGTIYLNAEKKAQAAAAATTTTNNSPKHLSLIHLLKEIKADKKLSSAATWDDGNKIKALMDRAPEETLKYTNAWTVDPAGGEKELEKRTVEMIQAAVWFTAGAQRPPKQVKFDFFFLHSVTASIFWPTFNTLPFLTLAQKIRLLEWKARTDLILYASRGCPPILTEEITNYISPKYPPSKNSDDNDEIWKDIFDRVFRKEEDGHIVKLVRALRYGKVVSTGFEGAKEEWVVVKGDMWERIGEMVVDSVEGEGADWVRNVGFEEAWGEVAERHTEKEKEADDGVEVDFRGLKL